ncbi:MAG: hypothetical protein JO224_08265 [Pelomonas sp.]|nr:hypothetical protein [Roseateles sp.]MBV8604658.1 hypothetical protein [Roseateles sp.]
MRRWLFVALAALVAGHARADVRDEEIASCRPGEIVTWGDGVDHAASAPLVFVYEPAGAPPWFARAAVYAEIQKALQGWAPCGVAATLLPLGQAAPASAIRIFWSDAEARGNAALANVPMRRLAIGVAVFQLLRQRNPNYPAEDTLQMALSHEIGHFHGLMAHSRRCVDVMSYYNDGHGGQCSLRDPAALRSRIEYRASLPTACDIARCRAVNAPGAAAR